mgnify:FL=1|jgi:hypothetical protein
MKTISREKLEEILKNWQTNKFDECKTHEEAEKLFDALEEIPELPKDDPDSILIEVLGKLEDLSAELVVKEDIPEILEFLKTPGGGELDAWEKWISYWGRIDFNMRQKNLKDNPYYSKLKIE